MIYISSQISEVKLKVNLIKKINYKDQIEDLQERGNNCHKLYLKLGGRVIFSYGEHHIL